MILVLYQNKIGSNPNTLNPEESVDKKTRFIFIKICQDIGNAFDQCDSKAKIKKLTCEFFISEEKEHTVYHCTRLHFDICLNNNKIKLLATVTLDSKNSDKELCYVNTKFTNLNDETIQESNRRVSIDDIKKTLAQSINSVKA